jgi:4'-phosphopantetheinyl transferase
MRVNTPQCYSSTKAVKIQLANTWIEQEKYGYSAFCMTRFMNCKQPEEENTLSIEAKLAESIVWTGTDPAIAWFEDNTSIAEDNIFEFLSPDEQFKAGQLSDTTERRHFAFRRCFQRCFLKTITGYPGELSTLAIVHRRDTRPRCETYPEYAISFSSSDSFAIAAASKTLQIGIDIERIRPIANVDALSRRFFHKSEAVYLDSLPGNQREMEFLKFWTVKEACLKAIGTGVVYGLDSFILSPRENSYHIDPPHEFTSYGKWTLELSAAPPGHVVAIAGFSRS